MIKLGIYKHHKGNLYQVIGLSRHVKTLEEYVVYQALYGDFGMWIRPLALFVDSVEQNDKLTPRFEFIREALIVAPLVDHHR